MLQRRVCGEKGKWRTAFGRPLVVRSDLGARTGGSALRLGCACPGVGPAGLIGCAERQRCAARRYRHLHRPGRSDRAFTITCGSITNRAPPRPMVSSVGSVGRHSRDACCTRACAVVPRLAAFTAGANLTRTAPRHLTTVSPDDAQVLTCGTDVGPVDEYGQVPERDDPHTRGQRFDAPTSPAVVPRKSRACASTSPSTVFAASSASRAARASAIAAGARFKSILRREFSSMAAPPATSRALMQPKAAARPASEQPAPPRGPRAFFSCSSAPAYRRQACACARRHGPLAAQRVDLRRCRAPEIALGGPLLVAQPGGLGLRLGFREPVTDLVGLGRAVGLFDADLAGSSAATVNPPPLRSACSMIATSASYGRHRNLNSAREPCGHCPPALRQRQLTGGCPRPGVIPRGVLPPRRRSAGHRHRYRRSHRWHPSRSATPGQRSCHRALFPSATDAGAALDRGQQSEVDSLRKDRQDTRSCASLPVNCSGLGCDTRSVVEMTAPC